jgi:hypothetical protein
MERGNAFDEFASKVLATYHEGEEEFWSDVMTTFLTDSTNGKSEFPRSSLELMGLFIAIDYHRRKFLKDYTTPLGFDINEWKSLNLKDKYYRDAYPIYAFLAIWMEENGLTDSLHSFGDMLRGVVYGIAGYGVLDVIVDGGDFSAVELLTAQKLIAEYETMMLKTFGVTEINLSILQQLRDRFLKAEIKEKSVRGEASPYDKEKPIDCGTKAAHLLTPFMLSLERLGKADLIDTYFEVFNSFGAVIQILDDIKDLEDDISIGHFSYVTLGTRTIPLYKEGYSAKEITNMLLDDQQHLTNIYLTCKKLIKYSNEILLELKDPFLARIVDVTALRLDSFFSKEVGLNITGEIMA